MIEGLDLPDPIDWDDSFLEQVEPPTGKQSTAIRRLSYTLELPDPIVMGYEDAAAWISEHSDILYTRNLEALALAMERLCYDNCILQRGELRGISN